MSSSRDDRQASERSAVVNAAAARAGRRRVFQSREAMLGVLVDGEMAGDEDYGDYFMSWQLVHLLEPGITEAEVDGTAPDFARRGRRRPGEAAPPASPPLVVRLPSARFIFKVSYAHPDGLRGLNWTHSNHSEGPRRGSNHISEPLLERWRLALLASEHDEAKLTTVGTHPTASDRRVQSWRPVGLSSSSSKQCADSSRQLVVADRKSVV